MSHYAIQTRHLTRDFDRIRAVDDLTLDVPHGIVFGFLGPNGSGKTTTIRMLLGLLEATKGGARVLDYDIATEAEQIRASTGALMAHNSFYEHLTVEGNLELYGYIHRLSKSERQARIRQLLKHMSLWDRREEMVRDWSKGLRQRLAIARILLHRPSLVILDEPTTGLDALEAAALRDDLASLVADESITVFLNTHNLSEAEKLCQQVGVIQRGKLLKVGRIDELRQQEKPRLEIIGHNFSQGLLSSLRAYPDVTSVQRTQSDSKESLRLELARAVEPSQFVNVIVDAGGQIDEIKHAPSALEDVFLSLTRDESAEV